MACGRRGCWSAGSPTTRSSYNATLRRNPPDNIDKGILTCNIGVAPTRPTEFVMISMVQEMGTGQEPG